MNAAYYPSRRHPVVGRAGMVASSQPLATAAGLEILTLGGNAADAAVATAAVLNVTEPTSTGLGGDMFAIFYDGNTRQVTAINGSGRAPSALTLELLHRDGLTELPPYHPYTVTVPGACAGWCDLVERHGTLGLPAILTPAIQLAEQGFAVAPITSHFWQIAADRQLKESLNGREMTLMGRGPYPGEFFRNPNLAKTLCMIAEKGKGAFYEGEIGEAIVSTLRQAGGCMRMDDLASHRSTWDVPISTSHAGFRLWECPPNGQGIAALMALNLLEGFDLPADPLAADRLHLEIEAMRLAFADARWYIDDPGYRKSETSGKATSYDWLLSMDYSKRRSRLITQGKQPLISSGEPRWLVRTRFIFAWSINGGTPARS
jgi:gamma-glutamyltranspeptidase/glutathione hydrolase